MREIIITGSNSELLSAELGSNLAGRFIEFRIQPFLFREYLKYHSLEVSSEADYYRLKQQINSLFYNYVKFGGLPETFQITDDETKQSYLSGILSKVVLDDIVKRFKVRNPDLLDMLLRYLLSNIGNHSSMIKIQKYLASQDFKIDTNTLFKYINYYPKTFVLYDLLEFDWKNSKVLNTNKKFYAVDTGVSNLHPPSTGNFSKQLENLVYLQLLSKYNPQDIFYASVGNYEIDFIVKTAGSITKIQVTQELNEDNETRELGSFTKLDKYLHCGENLLISLDDIEEVINYKEVQIRKINLIKWLAL
jgi:predicted AAA+ superfamily ATPase